MKPCIYISGSITNPETNQPREGWQKDFLEAEARLKEMGFEVINPTTIAEKTDSTFAHFGGDAPTRADYLSVCIDTLYVKARAGQLHGLYVIGHPDQVQQSYGTMCEINFALAASLPVYSQFYHGYQTDYRLRQITSKPTLAEAAKRNNE